MADITLYNLDGSTNGTITLSDAIFNETAKPELVYQAARVAELRLRQPLAHTKDRSEVSGGGKKPWKQKGTGRARHGSIRSPLWKGGGVTFGPRKESLTKPSINKKMAKKALRAVLTDRAQNDGIVAFIADTLTEPSTSVMVNFLKAIKKDSKRVVFVTAGSEDTVVRSVRNIPNVYTVRVDNINILDVLGTPVLCMSRDAIESLEKQLVKA